MRLKALRGTYVACTYTKETIDALCELQRVYEVPNPVPPEDFHTTIEYSRVYVPFPCETGLRFLANHGWLETWDVSDGTRCLVLRFESDHLQERHEIGRCLGATYDFPTYKPHITLSYNVGAAVFPDHEIQIDLVSDGEYSEELDPD